MWMRVADQRPFIAVLVALSVLSWLELSVWSFSPYAKYVNHEILEHTPVRFTFEYGGLLALFLIGWLLMTVAMMLPTSLPLLALFHRLVRARDDRRQLVSLLLAGYLGVWTLFGGLAHLGDLFVHEAVHRLAWLEADSWILGAATLALAGLYQFSGLKYSCLDKCRSPLNFIAEHWQGRRSARQSFWLGVRHGAFCLGCCWHLMLLMFAFACGNIGWMLALGSAMAVERNLGWGRGLTRPLGAGLLVAGLVFTITGLVSA